MSYSPLRVKRNDADTSSVVDGAASELHTNSVGRLKVSAIPGAFDAVTGTLSAVAQTVSADVTRASNVMVQVTSGTFAGLNFAFETSIDGGTTWFGTQAVRTNANTVEATSGVIAAAPVYGWELSVNACTHVRVRATAITSGTANIRILPGSYATEPIPAIQTHAVTMSTTTLSAGTTTVTPMTMIRDQAMTAKTTIKAATNGRVYSYFFYNPNTTDVWVHFYAALIASVTVGTTVPVWSVYVPAGGTAENVFTIPLGIATGITIAPTTSYLHTGSTAPATGILAEIGYI